MWHDSLAEWSKALASGASPQGRGIEPHSCYLVLTSRWYCHMFTHSHAAKDKTAQPTQQQLLLKQPQGKIYDYIFV